jgi:tetratricopeptide (TPR) repeat protein
MAGLVAASCGSSNDAGTATIATPPKVQQTAPAQSAPPVTPPQPPARFDAAAEYDKGSTLAAAGKLAEARAVFDGAHAQDPGEEAVAAAVEIFQDMDAGRVSADAVQRMFRAFEQGNAGQWQSAHEDADEVLRLAPRYARAHATKGGLYVLQGPAQYPNAIKSFDQALKVAPQFAEGYYSRGAVRAEMQQFDAANRGLQPRHRSAALHLVRVPEPGLRPRQQTRSGCCDCRLFKGV